MCSRLDGADYGLCIEGCRYDAECRENELCLCDKCVENGCRSDADCSEGSYCSGSSGIFGCNPRECEPLPEPVKCGDESCSYTLISTPLVDTLISACCPPEEPTECGLDVSLFGTSFVPCQVVTQSGVKDSDCPEVNTERYGTFPGCRRSDGQCGADASVIFKDFSPLLSTTTGLGCLLTQ
jgi:hypothetical protein